MAHTPKYPSVPTLYKVIEEGNSCNGGSYKWKTDGEVNQLPSHHKDKQLRHCSVGFHLTTNWRAWYAFDRDVYTARPWGNEILVKLLNSYSTVAENKVVVAACSLHDRNQDPLAKLFKNFYNDVVVQCKKLDSRVGKVKGPAPAGTKMKDTLSSVQQNNLGPIGFSASSFCGPGNLWHKHLVREYDTRSAMSRTVAYILGKLQKSVDEQLTQDERNKVHEVWNLWKSGWIVHGTHNGKYVVSRGYTGIQETKVKKAPPVPENHWPFPRRKK